VLNCPFVLSAFYLKRGRANAQPRRWQRCCRGIYRGDSFERYLRRNFGAGDKNDEGRAA
jgi:hypothetical protein